MGAQESCFYFAGKARGTKVVVQTQPLVLRDGLLDETSLLVIVQRSGDTFSIRAVSGTSGRVYEGKTVDALRFVLDAVRGGNGFAVETVADTAVNPKLDRARGHSGDLEFAGYSTRTVSDEDARRIALGADPVETLGAATLRWYRHFAGDEPWDKLGDGVLAIGRQLREYTDAPVCIINLAKSGKNSGTWPEGAKIAYVINRVALKNVDGYLYEGPADSKGIGPLAMEGGLGIPVQPYLPVFHETAIVKVAAERPA